MAATASSAPVGVRSLRARQSRVGPHRMMWRIRPSLRCEAAAGRGFGKKDAPPITPPAEPVGPFVRKVGNVEEAVFEIGNEMQEGKGGRGNHEGNHGGSSSNVPDEVVMEEATRGSVDFVEVESWDGLLDEAEGTEGQDEALQNLRVKPQSVSKEDHSKPFYERLCRRLETMERQGNLVLAGSRAHPPPPFETWRISARNYLVFLANMLTIHEAMEDAIAFLSAANAPVTSSLHALTVEGKLYRSQALRHDILSLSKAKNLPKPVPDAQARSLGEYIRALARCAAELHSPPEKDLYEKMREGGRGGGGSRKRKGTSKKKSVSHPSKEAHACSSLVALAFCIYVSHLTSGGRIGAKAAEQLNLGRVGAVAYFSQYPEIGGRGRKEKGKEEEEEEEEKDPVVAFRRGVDKAGILLGKDTFEVLNEVGKAMQKTSLLLSVLAVN